MGRRGSSESKSAVHPSVAGAARHARMDGTFTLTEKLVAQRFCWRDTPRLPRGQQSGEQRGQQGDADDQAQLGPGDAEGQAGVKLLEEVDGEDVARQNQAQHHPAQPSQHEESEEAEDREESLKYFVFFYASRTSC